MAWAYYRINDTKSAEASMKVAANLSGNLYGSSYPEAIGFWYDLERWYREWGREAEADTLRGELSRILTEPADMVNPGLESVDH